MISDRAKQIKPSATLSFLAKVKDLKKQGQDIVSLASGEPDFAPPSEAQMSAIAAVKEGFTKYAPTGGTLELKDAICEKFRRDNGLDYEPESVLVSNGAKQSLFNLIQVLVDPGDEVVVLVPYWVSYIEMIKMAGGAPKLIKTDTSKITAQDLEQAISAKTKVLMLNSPSNPAGIVYSREELEALAAVCVKHQIVVLSDEVYEKLVYGTEHVSIASLGSEIKELTFTINSLSKGFALPGWRVGYCAGPTEAIKAATALQDHSTSGANSIAQIAATAALSASSDWFEDVIEEYQKRRDYIIKELQEIEGIEPIYPDGAFYVFADVSQIIQGDPTIKDSASLCSALLDKAQVAVVPGADFGDDNSVRLSFATSLDQIKKGIQRIRDFADQITSK